jgi:scyllo-inositol 2-dehydrogenase (NADP+)
MGTAASAPIRAAVVGFGISGRVFHAPLIEADPSFSLDVIVTADPERAAAAAARYPKARIVPTAEAMFAAGRGS